MTTRTITLPARYLRFLGIGIALFCVLMLLAGCETGLLSFEKSDAAAKALQDNLEAIQSDGIVTAEEWQGHSQLAQAYYAALKEDAGGTDWTTLIATGLGSVLASFTGVNIYRNKREVQVWGPPPPAPPAT